jgi:hypothetical protein
MLQHSRFRTPSIVGTVAEHRAAWSLLWLLSPSHVGPLVPVVRPVPAAAPVVRSVVRYGKHECLILRQLDGERAEVWLLNGRYKHVVRLSQLEVEDEVA